MKSNAFEKFKLNSPCDGPIGKKQQHSKKLKKYFYRLSLFLACNVQTVNRVFFWYELQSIYCSHDTYAMCLTLHKQNRCLVSFSLPWLRQMCVGVYVCYSMFMKSKSEKIPKYCFLQHWPIDKCQIKQFNYSHAAHRCVR